MNGIKRGDELWVKRKSVGLDELERIVRLGRDIDSDNAEASPTVTYACATSATEKIKQPRFAHPRSYLPLIIL